MGSFRKKLVDQKILIRSDATMNSEAKYYPAFDYLRIILATTVAAVHMGLITWSPAGGYAVQIFFALSGWLIGGILLDSDVARLPRFYFNRAARIWIPYFVAIALLVLVSLLKDHVTPKWFEFIFYDVTFVYNFFGPPQLATSISLMPLAGTGNHFWSICAEEQFYLVAPMLLTLLPSSIGRSLWFWCVVAIFASASPYSYYFGAISLGVLAAVARTRFGDWHLQTIAAVLLAVCFVSMFSALYFETLPYNISAPISAISIVLLLARSGPHSAIGNFLGGVSFPLYLNHWIGGFIANYLFGKFGLRGSVYSETAGIAFALLVAAVLYTCIDLVIKRNRDQYFTVDRGKAIAICGFVIVTIGIVGGLIMT